jgi:hypothetical protein
MNQALENLQHCNGICTSLFCPITADKMSNQVCWLLNSIDGPYAGKLECLSKCALQLEDDTTSVFYVFYASLRAFFTCCGFNEELLPSFHFVVEDLDLTKTLICLDMPNVGAKYAGVRMPHYHWQEQHNRLSTAIFAFLAGSDVISMAAIKANKTLAHYHFLASSFRVLQELIQMHHPCLNNTHAPDYM